MTCHLRHSERRLPGRSRAWHARHGAAAHSAASPVVAPCRRQHTASERARGMRPLQPRTPAPAPSAPARAALHAAAGVCSRRRSSAGRVARLALALACAAAALRVAAAKPLSSMAIMKLNQIDPTVRRAPGRRNCARSCRARHWGLHAPTRAAARCASPGVPMGAARTPPAACGQRSAPRRARSVGRQCAVRESPAPSPDPLCGALCAPCAPAGGVQRRQRGRVLHAHRS